jgi:uncharacterized membrane protein
MFAAAGPRPTLAAVVRATLAAGATLVVLDLLWLGVLARDFYRSALSSLAREETQAMAAVLFYAMYLTAVVVYAVLGASGLGGAAKRGAALGFVAYATYELTNWAVLRDWPARLVPVDIAWGVLLTATAAAAGKLGARGPRSI